MVELRIQDDFVRVLKGICHAFASASSEGELNQALGRWLRTALRARTFSYALYVPDDRSRAPRLMFSEGKRPDGFGLEARRRYALLEKSPLRSEAAANPWETVLFLPMVTCGETLGVLELTAPTAAIDGALETLEAIAAQAAIVLRHLRDISSLHYEVEAATKLNRIREDRVNSGIALTAHEIKSPLLGTLAVMQVLEQMGTESGQGERLLRQAQRQLEDLAALTDELLRMTIGEAEPAMNPLNVADLVDKVIAMLPEEDRERVAAHGSANVVAQGNSIGLRNAVRHVLRHALRHTAKDDMVGIRIHDGEETALVTITDGGPRVPPGEREHIFDPFARDGRGPRSMDSLSLFAARRIVEAHGGEITLESRETRTSFTLQLPVAAREAQSVPS